MAEDETDYGDFEHDTSEARELTDPKYIEAAKRHHTFIPAP